MIRMTNKNKYESDFSNSFKKIIKEQNNLLINKTMNLSQTNYMLKNIKISAQD